MDKKNNVIKNVVAANSFPAILIGGPPCAGKSILTYTLTRELRRLDIPHFVFRASPDGEGDWFLRGDFDLSLLRQVQKQAKGSWSDELRAAICRDLSHRQLPLIVDIGGLPQDKDSSIFELCTHSILLLKDDEPQSTEIWRRFIANNGLQPIAELRSQLDGKSTITSRKPILTGIITGLIQEKHIRERMGDEVFYELFKLTKQLFASYTSEYIEAIHYGDTQIEFIVNLKHELYKIASDTDEWSAGFLIPLLASLPPHTEMAVYGRAPNWVYGALAMHTYPQPFHQFDACIGWIQPPMLRVGDPKKQSDKIITLLPQPRHLTDAYLVGVHVTHYYLDYSEADKLVFPEPPADKGVIVSGKLPFWLFASLARFYADRHVPWIALNYASSSCPIVIYSRVVSHSIGQLLPSLE